MKDARGHGSNIHGGVPSAVTAYGRGVMPAKPFRESDPSAQMHTRTDAGRTIFGLRQRLAQADSPGRAHAIIQAIKNFTGG